MWHNVRASASVRASAEKDFRDEREPSKIALNEGPVGQRIDGDNDGWPRAVRSITQ
jgi:hypothetical protein